MELIIPVIYGTAKTYNAIGRWALLVDDNTEVTTFYSRIASALNFKFFAATEVLEALQIVEKHGRPSFVISDLQLGNSSGILETAKDRTDGLVIVWI